jgi:flagellar biosynthesis/type III secretory pathway protein FliH
MTTLIRSSDPARAANVRALERRPATPPIAPVDPELVALRGELERLRAKLADQEVAIAGYPAALDKARADGEAAGRDVGRKEADDGRDALAAKIEAATALALKQFADEIASLERLAPLLAIEGLGRVFEPSDQRADLVREVIRRQLAGLEAQAIVCLEISSTDFPDADGLPRVQGAEVRALDALESGDCRIRLRLGALEVGLDQQWDRLREVLADLAKPRARP